MIRVTIDLVPKGDESRKRTIGLMEIANVGGTEEVGVYDVLLKKTPPFSGALFKDWRTSTFRTDEDEDYEYGRVPGMHRQKRGVYDLCYLALRACGMEKRNP